LTLFSVLILIFGLTIDSAAIFASNLNVTSTLLASLQAFWSISSSTPTLQPADFIIPPSTILNLLFLSESVSFLNNPPLSIFVIYSPLL
jgi:hypothetical protein